MHNEEEFGLYGIRAEVATAAACQACKALDGLGLMPEQTPFLQTWWAKHREQDEGRDVKNPPVKGVRGV